MHSETIMTAHHTFRDYTCVVRKLGWKEREIHIIVTSMMQIAKQIKIVLAQRKICHMLKQRPCPITQHHLDKYSSCELVDLSL